MCGFVGVFNPEVTPNIRESLDTISYRGPDSSTIWNDNFAFLGHNRLKIIDLSDEANQPLHHAHLHLIFNGEIYNYKKLRDKYQSEGYLFKTKTDTEVVLAAYWLYGEEALKQLDGMFAFVVYNEKTRSIFAARDRIGEKPLYYMQDGQTLVVASEIEPIIKLFPNRSFPLDKDGLIAFLMHGYNVPPPFTAYRDIRKLEPGYKLFWTPARDIKKKSYWQPNLSSFAGSLDDAVSVLDGLLNSSIKQSMESDLPVNSMLSGGIDSSLVTAIANQYKAPIHTYSLGMGPGDPELIRAQRISQQLGTTQTIVHYTDRDMQYGLKAFEDLQKHYHEPFNVFTAVYANHLYKEIGEKSTVCLTGNGADEIFGGYYGYSNYIKRLRRIRLFRPFLKKLVTPLSMFWPAGAQYIKAATHKNIQETMVSLALYGPLQHLKSLSPFLHSPIEIQAFLEERLQGVQSVQPLFQKLFIDLIYSHHHGTVMMADALPMRYSLELRSPFLNQKIIDFAYSLPENFLIDQKTGETKLVLKKLAEKYLPRDLIYIKKYGFGYSIDWSQYVLGKWHKKIQAKINSGVIQDYFGENIQTDIADLSASELLLLYSLAHFLENH